MENTNKTEVKNLLSELNRIIENQNQIKKLDLESQLEEKYEPLIKQAEAIKKDIQVKIDEKYKNEFDIMFKRRLELKKMLEEFNIQEAKTLWYPIGSTVYLWEYSGSWNSKLEKTSQKGIVTIYDGTQELSDTVHSANKPKIGDIIVLYCKKDGSVGKKFDRITQYGGEFCNRIYWYSEEHTPQNNLFTEKEKQEEEQQ